MIYKVVLPVFKKLKAAFKKTQANFWQKTQRYGGNFEYQEKTQKVLTEITRIYSEVLGIFNKFVEFSKY